MSASLRHESIVVPPLFTAPDMKVVCSIAPLVKVTEYVSIPAEGDLEATEFY